MSKLSRALKRLRGKSKKTEEPIATLPGNTLVSQTESLNLESLRQARIQKLSRPVSTPAIAPLQPRPQSVQIEAPAERKSLDAEEVKHESAIPTAPKKPAQVSSSEQTRASNSQPRPAPEPTVTAKEAIPRPTPPQYTLTADEVTTLTKQWHKGMSVEDIQKDFLPHTSREAIEAKYRALEKHKARVTDRTKQQDQDRAEHLVESTKVGNGKAKMFTTPNATSRRTPQATPYAPTLTSRSVPIRAVQRHAGLYSDFTPEVAAIDQPTPAIFYNAKKTASGVLLSGATPSSSSADYMRHSYAGQVDYTDLIPIPSYSSYATPSPYSSSKPLGTFHTGGAIGGGHPSTGGAVGGDAISHTVGWLGEDSVAQTGGSLGEAMGSQPPAQSFGLVHPPMPPLPIQPYSEDEIFIDHEAILDSLLAQRRRKYSGRSSGVAETSQDLFAPGPSTKPFAPESSRDPLGTGRGGPSARAPQQSQKPPKLTKREVWESLYDEESVREEPLK